MLLEKEENSARILRNQLVRGLKALNFIFGEEIVSWVPPIAL